MADTLTHMPTQQGSQINVRPITPTIGAVISGVDVARAGQDQVAAIRSALLKHKVVALRNQHINAEAYLSFAEKFGPTTLHHPISPRENKVSDSASAKAKTSVWERDNSYRSDHWHTDVTFIDRPVSITMLRCLACPEVGGDTLFANTVSAYERLPEPLRTLADSLRAIHTTREGMRSRGWWGSPEEHGMSTFVTEHPVVRVLSETGERSLVLGSFVELILGFTHEASTGLVKIFQDYILKPENLLRWSWKPGDLVMWDNRATQHYAANDYGDAARQMQRLTIAGGIPVGVDGRPSKVMIGDASMFSVIGPA